MNMTKSKTDLEKNKCLIFLNIRNMFLVVKSNSYVFSPSILTFWKESSLDTKNDRKK